MDFTFTEAQKKLQQAAREFVEEEIAAKAFKITSKSLVAEADRELSL